MLAGSYISDDGRYTAQLRKAGFYQDMGCKMARHYVIQLRGSNNIVGTATTLKDAERYL